MAILNILANFHQKSEAVLHKFNRKAPVLVCFILKKTPTTEVFSSGLCKMFKNGFSCRTPLVAASEKFHNEVLFTLDLRTTQPIIYTAEQSRHCITKLHTFIPLNSLTSCHTSYEAALLSCCWNRLILLKCYNKVAIFSCQSMFDHFSTRSMKRSALFDRIRNKCVITYAIIICSLKRFQQ